MTAADHSGDCTILNTIWGMIWNPKSEFYLPKVAKNGLKDPALGIDIQPFDSFSIPNIPDVTMFDEPVLGYMKIKLTDSAVSGISTVSGQNLKCDDQSSDKTTFSFDFAFSALNLAGSYTVSAGGGIGGCAIAATAAILGGHALGESASILEVAGQAETESNLALWYQGPLGESSNGQTLIGAYYDNQDSILDLQSEGGGQNPYTQSLSASNVHSTKSNVYAATDYYKNQKTGALSAEAAAEPAPTIGSDDQYSSGQLPYAYLIAMARQKANSGEDKDGRFAKLASDMTHFIGSITWYHTTYPGEQPVGGAGGVMDRIAMADPDKVFAFIAERSAIDFLDADVVETLGPEFRMHLEGYKPEPPNMDRWQRAYRTRVAAAADATSSDVDGTYNDKNMNITGSIAGSMSLVNGNLQVSISSITATVQSVDIDLNQTKGWWPGLYNKVVNWLANDTFIKGEIKKGIATGLTSDAMKSNLENLLNGALKSL